MDRHSCESRNPVKQSFHANPPNSDCFFQSIPVSRLASNSLTSFLSWWPIPWFRAIHTKQVDGHCIVQWILSLHYFYVPIPSWSSLTLHRHKAYHFSYLPKYILRGAYSYVVFWIPAFAGMTNSPEHRILKLALMIHCPPPLKVGIKLFSWITLKQGVWVICSIHNSSILSAQIAYPISHEHR